MIGQRISERVSIPNIDSDDLLLIADRSDAYIIKKMTTGDHYCGVRAKGCGFRCSVASRELRNHAPVRWKLAPFH
jgi:hypothetical protein